MIRLILDPYDTYSPYNKDLWQRIRKTRWTGDDGFEPEEPEKKAQNKRPRGRTSTALARIQNAVALGRPGANKKRSRWGSQARTKLTVDDMRQFQERTEMLGKISHKLMFPQCMPEPDDPFLKLEEPPPEYDANGQRTNTLEDRYREQLERDRNLLIYQLQQLNPTYTPPSNYKPPLFERIFWFPIRQYPEYNFIGAVLGPRGNTQKRLEKGTGCKIAIRGKGAEKNFVRRIRNPRTGDIEEMSHHVYLTAPTEEKMQEGIAVLRPLLRPQTELMRMEQMKELAMINGTYRFDMRCKECGDINHRDFQCPQRQNTYFANVQCEECGDLSHVTKDCPRRGLFSSTKAEMESEYSQFLQDVNGPDPRLAAAAPARPKAQPEMFRSKLLNTAVTVMKPNSDAANAAAQLLARNAQYEPGAAGSSVTQKRDYYTS